MQLWIGIATACLLWFLFYLLLTQVGGHGGVAEGSTGGFYIVWFVMVGAFLSIPLGLLIAFGLHGRLSAPLPDSPDEAFEWHMTVLIVMVAGASLAAYVSTRGLVVPHLKINKDLVIEHVTGGNSLAYYLFLLTEWIASGILLITFFTSPAWIGIALWGLIKLIVIWASRPRVHTEAQLLAAGEPVTTEALQRALYAAIPSSLTPPWWLWLPGATQFAQWRDQSRAWWAKRTAEQLRTAADQAEAVQHAMRSRAKAGGERHDG